MEINTTNISLYGIPPYLFCACIATVVGICTYIMLLSEKQYPIDRYLKRLAVAIIGLVIMARLFGCLSGIFGAVGRHETITWGTVKNTGIVFYGGLIGLLITYRITLLRSNDTLSLSSMDILAVTIPLFHGISRVGCFLGGCCYGMICESPISVTYTTDIMGEICTEDRLPIQLIEAFLNFGLFLYLFHLFKRDDWKEQHILKKYLIIYSTLRFVLEFFRGDMNRGIIAGISFSQVISIIILLVILVQHKKKKRYLEGNIYESS